ncbi:MAG: hypothetical protein ACK4ND_00175 [Cytophagaceae bacterium]
MKPTPFFILFAIIFLQSASVFGQKITVVSGDLKAIKGLKKLNIEYDYSNMSVGKYDKEEDYVNEKVAEKNEANPGKGDEWKGKWIGDREKRFQPKFEELFKKYLKADISIGQFDDADYTMVLRTTHTEPGFNIGMGIIRKVAHTNLEAVFYKKGSNSPVLVISIYRSPGEDAMGYDFDRAHRIQESYAKAGKSLGKFITNKCLK